MMKQYLIPSFVLFAIAISLLSGCASPSPSKPCVDFTYAHGGIVRGSTDTKELALVFTGGDHGEGTEAILDTLRAAGIHASFFVTGGYLRNPEYVPLVKRMVAEGHLVGPHSDQHLLYCPWDDRSRSLVDKSTFQSDLRKNIRDLQAIGASDTTGPVWFIPPFEWFNEDQVAWCREMNVILFNFTPGTGSNRDWAPESHGSFVPSQTIYEDILSYEARKPDGLNGFLLLLHLGSQRTDKMHPFVKPLIAELMKRGYRFRRVDELLAPSRACLSGVEVGVTGTCVFQRCCR